MIPELGHFCLILAFVMAGLQFILRPAILPVRTATLQAALLLISFACLTWSYVTSDFSVRNVAENSHTLKPMLYKIAGVWGNHEGSMLLWSLILALYGLWIARQKNLSADLRLWALRTQGFLGFGFLAFVIFTSNPFARLSLPPVDGEGLNPILQDIGLAFHPPLLYLGYVGFSSVFSLAVGALMTGRMDRLWAREVKPFILLAWTTLSGGIALGSWWAYYELGWGGWWFWDPVENASLMPWLTGTALLHSVIVLEKREGLQKWTCLMAILAFSLSMLGTFLVRSGVLTSVHAFASDPARGTFILCLLALYTGGALLIYAARVAKLEAAPITFAPISRESALIINNLFTLTACATVVIGTLYPLLADALDLGALTVGAPYFNATIIPLALPAFILMGLSPFLPWKKTDLSTLWARISTPLLMLASGIIVFLIYALEGAPLVWGALIAALWLICASSWEWLLATDFGKRARVLPLTHHGMSLAHLGMGIALLGMVGSTIWMSEKIEAMHPGDQIDIAGYTLKLEGVGATFGENYAADTARIKVHHFGVTQPFMTLYPESRFYPTGGKKTTEAAIYTTWGEDLYVAIGQSMGGLSAQEKENAAQNNEWIVRAYVHPLIGFLWAGFAMIALGGLLCFLERKGHPRHA